MKCAILRDEVWLRGGVPFMFTQRNQKADCEKAIKEAIGVNTSLFDKKMGWLQKKWTNAKDGRVARLICPIVLHKTTPVNISIIADNLEYFEKNYKDQYENSLDKALARACLCGSQKIAEFLLEKLHANFMTENYEYVFGYASASMNNEWVEKIATTMAAANKDMPKSIFIVGNDIKTIDKIRKIFKEKHSIKSNRLGVRRY